MENKAWEDETKELEFRGKRVSDIVNACSEEILSGEARYRHMMIVRPKAHYLLQTTLLKGMLGGDASRMYAETNIWDISQDETAPNIFENLKNRYPWIASIATSSKQEAAAVHTFLRKSLTEGLVH